MWVGICLSEFLLSPPIRRGSAIERHLGGMDFPEELADPDLVEALVKVRLRLKVNPQNPRLLALELGEQGDVVIVPRISRERSSAFAFSLYTRFVSLSA